MEGFFQINSPSSDMATADRSKLQEVREKTKKIYECSVCLNLPECAIYQCSEGHLICRECYHKIPRPINGIIRGPIMCPSCRRELPVEPIRNRAAEQVRNLKLLVCHLIQ